MIFELIENQSIRSFLFEYHLGKEKIYDLFLRKAILVDGKNINFDIQLAKGTKLDINLDEEINYTPMEGQLDIVYEDDDILVVNKKAGIIIHDEKNSLANIVAYYYQKNNLNRAVRFPSRLDNETSGIMLFAKNFLAASYFDYLFREHQVKKTYLALVLHSFNDLKGKINFKIGTDRHVNGKMCTSSNGKEALTHYEVIKQNKEIAYVKVQIKTGRTHQIRVHMSKINHPLLGDNLYGNSSYNRVMLHAYSLEFIHPKTHQKMTINANLNEDFKTIIDSI